MTRGDKVTPIGKRKPQAGNAPRKIQPVAERFPAAEEQEVDLTFFAPEAKVVEVAGSFNRWHPEENRLDRTGSGEHNSVITVGLDDRTDLL